MRTFIYSIGIIFFITSSFAKPNMDRRQRLNGVSLKSGKVDAVRTFKGTTQRTFYYPLDLVKKGVTNFTEKCNNQLRDKRKYTAKNVHCKYHNENLVESFTVKDIKRNELKEFSEVYLLGRQVYNRGSFGYYELVTIKEILNENKQRTAIISLRMLNDSEVKKFTTPKVYKESAFDSSTSIFTLTELSPTETHLKFEYSADTDHWLLNKEVSVPQVFASISKSINDLVNTVETESFRQKRELASQE